MATPIALLLLLLLLLLLVISPTAYAATTHTVGDSTSWTNSGFDYNSWSNGQTFRIGDTLVFNYDFSHAVDQVSQSDYTNCKKDNPIKAYTTSPTSITLNSIGMWYFICPRSNHCSQGMKVAINVVGATTGPSGPPPTGSAGSPPTGSSGPPETPGNNSPSSPSPSKPNNNDAGILAGCRTSNMAMLVVVLATLLGVWV